jgi:RHS repeat-associated protein
MPTRLGLSPLSKLSVRFASGGFVVPFLVSLVVLALFPVGSALGADDHAGGGAQGEVRNPVLTAPRDAVEEIAERRTVNSTTWSAKDGSRITRAALEPVRWRDGQGDWRSFDFALKRRGDHLAPEGWRVDTTPVAIELPSALGESGDDSWVLTAGEDRIAMALKGAHAPATVDGTHARYSDAVPGVTVELGAVVDGLKETLSLAGPSATSDYEYAIKLSEGLELSTDKRSGAVVVSRAGRTVFLLPVPVVTDAAGQPAPSPVYTVRELGDGIASLSFSVDRRWLARPEREWPVVVDPTTSVVSSTAPISRMCPAGGLDVTTLCNDPNMAATGYLVSGTALLGQQRVGLRFSPLTYLADDDYIDSAHLKMYQMSNVVTGAATDQGVIASAISADWTTSRDYPYYGYPFLQGNPPAVRLNPDLSSKGTAAPVVGAGWLDVNLTDVVGYWQRYRTYPVEGIPDYGVQLSRAATPAGTRIDTRIAPTGTANAPYLEIKSIAAAPAGAEVTSPKEGLMTARRVKLVAHAPNASVTSMTFQYVAGTQRYWTDIPASALRFRDGTSVTSTNIPVNAASGGGVDNKPLVWDLQSTTGGNIDGSVHVRAVLTGPAGTNGATEPVNFKLDRRDPQKQATAPIGPGQVNLLTGDFSVSSQDVDLASFDGGLAVSRTYHSRNVSTRDAEMFGPHWAASFAGDGGALPYADLYNYSEVKEEQVTRWVTAPGTYGYEADFDAGEEEAGTDPAALSNSLDLWTPVTDTVRWTYNYAEVNTSNGSKFTFTQVTDPNGNVTGWEPDADHVGMKLTGSAGNPWVLTETDGSTTTFARDAVGSPNYHVTTFTRPGSSATPTLDYQVVNGRYRLTKVTAGKHTVNAQEDRYLKFIWQQNAATGNQPRVTSINHGYWSGSATTERVIQNYVYDTQGRLVSAVNPRLSAAAGTTSYHYHPTNGHVDLITAPGQATWRMAYTTRPGDDNTGRLLLVKRVHSTLGSDATWTVRYGIALTGTDAPTSMTTARMATWDQTDDLPTDATAVSIPSHVPATPTEWALGSTVYYMDADGREVNRLRGMGESVTLSTTQYDVNGNVVMELSGQNRRTALASTTVPTQQAAQALETVHHYDSNGVDRLWTLGPTHKMTVPGVGEVNGRTRTVTSYDANSPGGAEYHLPTSVAVSAQYDDSSGTHIADSRITTYGYDGADSAGFPNRGWALRMPTSVTVDPGGGAAPMTTKTVYYANAPLVATVRRPANAGGFGSAHQTSFLYYGINSFQHYEWTGQLMRKSTVVASPEAPMPTVTTHDYNADLNPLSIITTGTNGLRTETLGYDNAGRPTNRGAQFYDSGIMVDDSTISMSYDNQGHVSTVTNASDPAHPLTSTYDNNGRLSSYTDSKGSVTTSTYNINGALVSKTDPHGTRTYGYNSRLLPTTINDSQFGAVTGTWDEDGNLKTQNVLGQLTTTTWNAAGEATDRVHSKASCSCVWAEDHIRYDAGGRIVAETTGTGKRSQTMAYDGAGRLKEVQDKAAVSATDCFTRVYGYDVNSNRTSVTAYPAASAGACAKTTAPSTKTSVYDSADRITSSAGNAVTYDGILRVQSVWGPLPGPLPGIGYDVNDQVASVLKPLGFPVTFSRDPIMRTSTTDPGNGPANPTTYHYEDGASGASWSETGIVWTRFLKGLDDELIARKASDQTAPTMMLSNLRGDVIAEGVTSGAAPTWRGVFDEFGNQLTGAHRDYGWFGSVGLLTGPSPGVMQMGARTYLAPIGRFLQTDPVSGGSANAYDYANQDPFNQMDLGGREPGSAQSMKEAQKWIKKYYKCVDLWANNGAYYMRCFRHRQGLEGCIKEMTSVDLDPDEIVKPTGLLKLFASLAPGILVQEYMCFRGARRVK